MRPNTYFDWCHFRVRSRASSKWPILGDIPIVGQFFRSRTGTRQKRELVIMATPQIIDDTQGGIYGYGYTQSRQAATYLSH